MKRKKHTKRELSWFRTYLEIAKKIASMSHAKRRKVGAVIVRDGSIIDFGYNGMPSGYDNCCEHEQNGELVTRPEVLHAEANAITKVAKSVRSTDGATLYITLSPCLECSKLIVQSGIERVVYDEQYRKTDGLAFLEANNIEIIQLKLDNAH